MNKWLRRSAFIFMLAFVTALTGFAIKDGDKDKDKDKSDKSSMVCRDDWHSDRLSSHCEIKEQTLPASGSVSVDGRQNGGVSVKGWDRNEILVRARIQTAAPTQAEADALAQQITIETAGAKIFANGPETRRDYFWSASFEVFVPRHSDLALTAHNGGIAISDVQGRLEFTAVNGGVALKRVGGDVHGETTNGGLSIELTGDRWDGEAMDVKTTTGGISMSVPENYSAHLETGTVNGNLSIDFPVTMQGRISREIAVNLGSGGPTIRAMTTNGGVRVKRGSGN